MKKISIANAIPVLAASAFLTACNAYDQDLSPGGNTIIEAVCPAPTLEEPATRTAVDPTAYTSGEIGINWLPADRIGVYSATTANACFTNQSEQETDKTSFAGNLQIGETPLYAYYPYTANPTNDLIEFQVPEAAVQSEQKVYDFLFASGAASYANPSLTLNFTHQMVRVIIKVYTSPEYGFTTNDFAGSLLTFVGYFDSGTFNIKTGKVECSDESVTTYYFGDPQSDHMEYTLYVPAQVMPDMTLQLSNGENFVFLTNDTWKAGHSYSYSLKPVRNTLEVISATISPWTVESEKTINGYE